jgi:hypothetical protein
MLRLEKPTKPGRRLTMTHTKDKLAEELRKAGLDEMAARAEAGDYHDFLSDLAAPALQLSVDLANAGTPEAMALLVRHNAGEFDASLEESDEWAKSPDGQAAFGKLMKGE